MRYRIAAALALTLFVLDLLLKPGGLTVTRAIDDVGQCVVAGIAAYCGLRQARRAEGRLRTSWLLFGIGASAWTVGAGLWAYYELIASHATPFPSPADAGYLLFAPFAAAGLLMRPSGAFRGWGRLRVALDGLLLAASLLAISWVAVLEDIYRAEGGSMLANAVGLIYPVSDIALLTVLGVVMWHSSAPNRRGLLFLAAGVAGFACADSGFAYLSATGGYATGSLIDVAWVAGFLLLAFGTALDDPGVPRVDHRAGAAQGALLLPYLPAAGAVVADLMELRHDPHDVVAVVTAALIVALLLWRHSLVLLDNRALITRIEHQARHDSLTGLANRAVFEERLEHALALHQRGTRSISVLLLDVDDFKIVNDTMGHPAGDRLLVHLAGLLRRALRAGDTLARLGGDEFVIIDEQSSNPVRLAHRIQTLLSEPVEIDGRTLAVSASIGIARLDGSDPVSSAASMLQEADLAMYAAKRAGKGEIRHYTGDLGAAGGRELDLRCELAAGVIDRKITVGFLPIHRTDGAVFGYETVPTWTGGDEVLSGRALLKAARHVGLRANVDRLLVRAAAAEAAVRDPDCVMLVPVDARTLAEPGFAAFVADVVDTTTIAASRLVVEVSAYDLDENDQARGAVGALRSFGVGLAVDDLCQSQLAILERLEPDVVKVDWRLASSTGRHLGRGLSAEYLPQWVPPPGAVLVADGADSRTPMAALSATGCMARIDGPATDDCEAARAPGSQPHGAGDEPPTTAADRTGCDPIDAGRGGTWPLSAAGSPR